MKYFLSFAKNKNLKYDSMPTLPQNTQLTMLVGTYTYDTSRGIYTFRFNQLTGEHIALQCADVTNPSFLAITHDNNIVYSVTENGNDSKINAHRFNAASGTLEHINSVNAEADPCHIRILPNGLICTANYSDGSISLFKTNADGSIRPEHEVIRFSAPTGPNTKRQNGAHVHFTLLSPDDRFLLTNDLGTDRIHALDLNSNMSSLTDTTVHPGYGPRHSIFSTDGKHLYLINELSGHVIAYRYDHNSGLLHEIQDSLADETNAGGSADICISPDGRFLYTSHRLENDGISVFAIAEDGTLTKTNYLSTGKHPRNFIITPNGKYMLVACRDDNFIEVLLRDPSTGALNDTGERIAVPRPVCIKFANQE